MCIRRCEIRHQEYALSKWAPSDKNCSRRSSSMILVIGSGNSARSGYSGAKERPDLGITVDQLFDPCTNLRAGARVLTAEYQRAAAVRGEGQDALQQALSEYNSGSSTVGFDNGYVSSVVNGEFFSKSAPR